jgi:hypothetical protein
MTIRSEVLSSIARTVRDYRLLDLEPATPERIDAWVSQFDRDVQLPILSEMDHVLKSTYFSLEKVTGFLRGLRESSNLVGSDPRGFWRQVTFLDIQGGGNSQTEMLTLLSEILTEKFGFGIDECGEGGAVFVYLDDAIFTGNRVRRDLETWIVENAPEKADVHVICIALHTGGWYYAKQRIEAKAREVRKTIKLTCWRAIELEDRRAYSHAADVLRPTSIPDDPAVRAYVAEMKYAPTLREGGTRSASDLFSTEAGRTLLEQELLKAGAKIRQICTNLGTTQRPLGHITLDTLGFGSLIVTFRNCPNNAPLALWVGEPWIPLFPRTTNSQTSISRLFANTFGDRNR